MTLKRSLLKSGLIGLTLASTYTFFKYFVWVFVVPCGIPSILEYAISSLVGAGLFGLWVLTLAALSD